MLKITILHCLLFVLVIKAYAHVEEVYSLEGTFGERQVILEISNSDEFYTARYCFRDEKKDIYMKAIYDSAHFILASSKYNPKTKKTVVIEQVEITEDADYNWSGTWISPDGLLHKVILQPIQRDTTKEHTIKSLSLKNKISLYTYSRLRNIKYETVKSQRFKKGIQVVWLKEPTSGITGFRINKGFNESAMQKINELLEYIHLRDIERSLSCGSIGFKGKYNQSIKITYLTHNILSFVKSINGDCFNTGQQFSMEYFTYDLKTTNEIWIEDLLWMNEGVKVRKGSKEYFEYRRKVFCNKIQDYINKTYQKEIKASDCNFNNENIYQFPKYYLTKKGMLLVPDHYSLSAECKNINWMVLLYKDFPTFWNQMYFKAN